MALFWWNVVWTATKRNLTKFRLKIFFHWQTVPNFLEFFPVDRSTYHWDFFLSMVVNWYHSLIYNVGDESGGCDIPCAGSDLPPGLKDDANCLFSKLN
jgi:hypothetical protein